MNTESTSKGGTAPLADSIVCNVVQEFISRSMVGQNKYGTNMDRKDLSIDQWMIHLKEEMMDGLIYLEKIRVEFDLLNKEFEALKASKEANPMTIKYTWHK